MDKEAQKYGMPQFSDLRISTITSMVFTNIVFNRLQIFKNINIHLPQTSFTKKKKKIDKKNITSEYGTIFSAFMELKNRGVYMKREKKYWCTFCQPYEKKKNGVKVESKTVEEILVSLHPSDPESYGLSDVYKLYFYCKNCKHIYPKKKIQKIVGFQNQLTVVLSLGDVNVNMMIFKDSIKIAGCKMKENMYEAVMILWENYITKIEGAWECSKSIPENKLDFYPSLSPNFNNPHFLFSIVMENFDFKLGFTIDREKTQKLLDKKDYCDKIERAIYEPSSRTNVGVKMFSKKPEKQFLPCLVYENDECVRNLNETIKFNPYFICLHKHIFRKEKKKNKKRKNVTFMIFGSSKIILSGRYEEENEELYYFFIKTMFENKQKIIIEISKPSVSLEKFLLNNN